jgi:hypothetical protein
LNDARDQNHRAPDDEQAFTGWLSVTTAATGYMVPWAQLGVQSSSLYVPVPVADAADHVVQVIAYRIAVLSPDSGQPDAQPGSCSGGALMSCPGARNVSAAVCDAGGGCDTEGDVADVAEEAGDAAGAVGEPADEPEPATGGELVAEPHAATSTVHASTVQASADRASVVRASLDRASVVQASAAQAVAGWALRESTVPMIPTPVGDTTARSA